MRRLAASAAPSRPGEQKEGAAIADITKLPRKSIFLLTHEQKLRLLRDQGPSLCGAGILCRTSSYPYHKEAAALRDELTQVLQQADYILTPDISQSVEKQIQLPETEAALVDKYLSELEKAKNEYVYQSEKEKVCPLFPLVAFPKMNIGFGDRQRMEERNVSRQRKKATVVDEDADAEKEEETEESEGEPTVPSCLTCHRVLQLYKLRY